MSKLVGVLRLQWLSYWRGIARGGNGAKSGLILLGLIAVGMAARYVAILKSVAGSVRVGQFGELDLLAAAAMALCASPVWEGSARAMGPRPLSRFPLTGLERLAARIWIGFVSPFSWIAALSCAAVLWPLAQSAHPGFAVAAGLALMAGSFLAGLAVRHVLGTARGKSAGLVGAIVLFASAAILWMRLGRGSTVVLRYLPSHWAVVAAQGSWVACLALLAGAIAAAWIAFRSLIWMLESAPRATAPTASGSAAMTVLRKDLRFFARAETTIWVILLGLVLYLATAAAPEPDAVRAVLAFTSVLAAAGAMNSFGVDGAAGLYRYGLWPVNGAKIIAEKNRALGILAAVRWGPVLALAFWRFGWREGMYDSVEAASLLLATLAWGNVTSVRHPYVGDESPSLIDQVIGLVASALPGALTIGVLRGDGAVPYAMFGMLAVTALLYAAGLRWASGHYARNFDAMRDGLA